MIRGSIFVAMVAIFLSLSLHLLGFSMTSPVSEGQSAENTASDAVELGNAFEDFAETPPEPIEPETAEVPEPPVETPAEPEKAEIPTSRAQVASPDPQRVSSPDTGSAPVTQPDVPEQLATEVVDQPEDEGGTSDQETVIPPVEPDTVVETPLGDPDTGAEPVEAPTAETPEPELLAALPVPETFEALPESEVNEPDIPNVVVGEDVQNPETDAEVSASEQAVTASIRPRLPDSRPSQTSQGVSDGSDEFANLRFPERVVDSPLTLYRRQGVDVFRHSDSASSSGGRGPGNSDTTNYAGQVLVHLNRTPPVFVSARGFARVFFQINADGTLAWVDVIDSSGSAEVDRAAKEQVQRADPFPRPPGGASRKLSFVYRSG